MKKEGIGKEPETTRNSPSTLEAEKGGRYPQPCRVYIRSIIKGVGKKNVPALTTPREKNRVSEAHWESFTGRKSYMPKGREAYLGGLGKIIRAHIIGTGRSDRTKGMGFLKSRHYTC